MKRFCATATFYAVANTLLLATLLSPGAISTVAGAADDLAKGDKGKSDKTKPNDGKDLGDKRNNDQGDHGEQLRARRQGVWIRVQLPIDTTVFQQTRQRIQRELGEGKESRPVFILEFVARDLNNAGQSTQFEDAHKLAKFLSSDELNGATKVAYIPKALYGHAVLVALACDQIVMAADAKLGDAGFDEKEISKMLLDAYQETASKRRNVPAQVALGMLDKSREVYKVTTDAGVEFVDAPGLAELNRKHRVLSEKRVKAPGEAWQFTGSEGRELGIVNQLAEDQRDVARVLELSPDIIQGDPSNGNPWRAVRVDIHTPIHPGLVDDIIQTIEKQQHDGANFFCIAIDSPGGWPSDSRRLADYLINLDHSQIRTVAYIANEARGDAAWIAMGCDQIVMGPDAKLGGAGVRPMTEMEVARYRQSISESLTKRNLRSWSLWVAMFDRRMEVFRCTRAGDVDYFCDDELEQRQPNNNQGDKGTIWRKGEPVHPFGRERELTGRRAVELGLANKVVNNFDEFKHQYGLENDVTLAEPGWVVHLAKFLSTPEMATLLLVVGIIGLYIELHAPGVGIGAFVSMVCFALFFWSRYLEGTAGWLQVTLFVTGILCVMVELTLFPGLMIFGVGGGALIMASIVLAGQTYWIPRNEYQLAQLERTLISLSVAIVATAGALFVLNRWLPRAPLFQHVFLTPPEGEEAEIISRREMLANFENLLGAVGVASTPLGPSGKAMFGDHLVDCISSGEFIPRDANVAVVEVRGNRVVVRAVDV